MAESRSMKKRAGRRTSCKTYRSGGRVSRKASLRKARKEKKSRKTKRGKRKSYRNKRTKKVMRGG